MLLDLTRRGDSGIPICQSQAFATTSQTPQLPALLRLTAMTLRRLMDCPGNPKPLNPKPWLSHYTHDMCTTLLQCEPWVSLQRAAQQLLPASWLSELGTRLQAEALCLRSHFTAAKHCSQTLRSLRLRAREQIFAEQRAQRPPSTLQPQGAEHPSPEKLKHLSSARVSSNKYRSLQKPETPKHH